MCYAPARELLCAVIFLDNAQVRGEIESGAFILYFPLTLWPSHYVRGFLPPRSRYRKSNLKKKNGGASIN